jgi:hypothetical protein
MSFDDIERGEISEEIPEEFTLVQTPIEEPIRLSQANIELPVEHIDQAVELLTTPEDLATLTLRAILALAGRAANRIRHQSPVEMPERSKRKFFSAIDNAIKGAYDFASGTTLNIKFLQKILSIHAKSCDVAPDVIFDPNDRVFHVSRKKDLAASAINASRAALNGTWAELFRGRSDCRPEDFPASVSGSKLAAFYAIQYGIADRRDFERLLHIGRGDPSSLGDPIDPSEHGPLGPLF